jgi:arginyl-tRNA synthetase
MQARSRPRDPPAGVTPTPLDGLHAAVLEAVAEVEQQTTSETAASSARGAITLERPPRAELGDYSTNAALLLAPRVGAPPREVAQGLAERLQRRLGDELDRTDVAGPGFLNLFLADAWHARALTHALHASEPGAAPVGAGTPSERILIEFVSANPTGPLHVGHARNAAYGDALARLLSACGHEVSREFYVNDAGSQIRKLGESVLALARGEPVPEDGYKGDYVQALVHLAAEAGDADADAVGRAAVGVVIERMKESLRAFNVADFDHWSWESALHEGDQSPAQRALATLERAGRTYESEGALWLRTTEFGDDKDRVLVRSTGEHTYFASDIAYHEDKRERGVERQILVLGADHHGYIGRMKAAFAALGGDPDQLELLIMQLVHLIASGERAQMSKRAGEFVTLDELVAEIGVDAARWYLLSRSHDTTVDLDLELARRESAENPVYYVQYAHARIASVLAKAGRERVDAAVAGVGELPAVPMHASERALIKQLLAFPSELITAAERRAPHRIAAYALELAQSFTAFYRDCRVVGAEPAAIESLRVALCVASMRTIARALELLGVRAPEEM